MDLSTFIQKYSITQSDALARICNEGLLRMSRNLDPHHKLEHVNNLFSELDQFLVEEKDVFHQINFDILIPAICWHDCWKGLKAQTSNIFEFVFKEYYEGVGSSLLFSNYLREYSIQIPQNIVRNIKYCIRKHASKDLELKLFPLKTLEAKILFDIDNLDSWSIARLNVIKANYISHDKPINTRFISIGKWWFFHEMQYKNDKLYSFAYSKREFARRKALILDEIYAIWNSLPEYLNMSDPKVLSMLKINPKNVDITKVVDHYALYSKK